MLHNHQDICCNNDIQDAVVSIGPINNSDDATQCSRLDSNVTQKYNCQLSGQWIFIVSSTDSLSTIISFEELEVYSACSDCHSNSNSPTGTMSSSACTCNSGFTNTTRQNRGTCTGCAPGKYKTLKANSLCTNCLPGQYSTEENSITNQYINYTQHSTSLA